MGLLTVSTEDDEFKDEGMREFMCKVVATEHDEDGGGQEQPRQDVQEGVHAQIQPAAAHQHTTKPRKNAMNF